MTDWSQIEHWDRSYYLHNTQAKDEHHFTAVDHQDGNYIYLSNGTKLLDFQSQLISDSFGHRHHRIYNEIKNAMERYGHVFFGMSHEYRARAAKLIINDVVNSSDPRWAGRVRILASGTEAVENSITIARLYSGKQIILTQAHSFHGLTVGATMLRGYRNNITTNPKEHTVRDVPGFPTAGFIPIPPPERFDFDKDFLPSISATEAMIKAVGQENIAGIITEPMFGAGGLANHHEYLKSIFTLCKKYNILWIDDEVLCGFGRLGEWFGYQLYDDICPDIMAVGKTINGSSLPAGAVIVNKEISEFIENARWWSGSTWDGHPLICASIVGTLEMMLEENYLDKIKQKGKYLKEKLDIISEKHPSVGSVGGHGLFYAVDLVNKDNQPIIADDRWTSFQGDLSQHPNNIVGQECAKEGVFLGGFVPNTIKVGPPFTIEESEIDKGINAFDKALTVIDKMFC